MGSTMSPAQTKRHYDGMRLTRKLWKADQYKNVYWSTDGAGKVNPSDDLIALVRDRYGLTPEHLAMHTAEDLNKVSGNTLFISAQPSFPNIV